MSVGALELDLDVFSGPFDLLLTLVLREEIDLLEVQVADVVLAYLDHLESRGQLDLDAATEFIVLVAALIELKSRLLLPGGDEEEDGLEPIEAADELLARMMEARRYRFAAEHLAGRLAREAGWRYRRASPPAWLRRRRVAEAHGLYSSDLLGEALGGLLRHPPPISLRHVSVARVSLGERLEHLRSLLRAHARVSFDEAVRGADRVTVAVTLFALLEMHKRGEATWEQLQPFGPISLSSPGIQEAPAQAAVREAAPA